MATGWKIFACGVMLGGWLVLGAAVAEAFVVQDGPAAQNAPSGPVPIEVYGAEPQIDFISLSPSGDLFARVEIVDNQRTLIVTRLADLGTVYAGRIGPVKVRNLRFIDEDNILVSTTQTENMTALGAKVMELPFGLILDIKQNKRVQVLDRTPGVLPSPYGPVEVHYTSSGAMVLARGYGVGTSDAHLYRIDLRGGRGRVARRMSTDVESFVTNADGEVQAVAEYEQQKGLWKLRLRSGDVLREVWSTTALVDTPVLMGMGRSPDKVLVSAQRADVRSASADSDDGFTLFEVDIASGQWTPLEAEHEPRNLIFHPKTKLLIGYSHTEDMGTRYSFYDGLAQRRWQAIERAFAGKYPSPIDWSHDMGAIIVYLNKGEAGHYQLVDFRTGEAEIVGEQFPALTADKVGQVTYVPYMAADGLEIPAYLTLPPGVTEARNLPLVVLPHGGPAARDSAGFDYWAQSLASRGYAVLQPNFRGSTGYGLAFLEAGYGQWGRKMQTDLSDGVRYLASQGMIDPSRVCIMGASYGGYAAMAGLALDSDVYRCAVAVNGVSDLRLMLRMTAEQSGSRSSPAIRYWTRFMGADGIRDRELDAYSPAMQAGQIKAPMLLIHGKDDTVVPIAQSRAMASAMRQANKPVEFIELNGEDHWLSRPETRTRMLQEAIRFLEAHNPPD